jgi:plastocyanin
MLLWSSLSSAPSSGSVLGIDDVAGVPLSHGLSITLSRTSNTFEPRAGVLVSSGIVTFRNALDSPLLIRTATLAPQAFAVRIGPHQRARVRLGRPGLYHYYDALTSRAGRVVANNQVITSAARLDPPREGWVAVVPRAPTSSGVLTVPSNQDLFTPKLVVTVVGDTVVVANHDADAHNFVVDPASPMGAAFIVDGTQNEPPDGWERALVLREAGLYHVYCTFHTRVVAVKDGWHIVVPRPQASGYHDHNPMDAWIVALPATGSG